MPSENQIAAGEAQRTIAQVRTRYRRMKLSPFVRSGHSTEGEKLCDYRHGHVLSAHEELIVCRVCGACWRDEGF
jgi:hypothetical protein